MMRFTIGFWLAVATLAPLVMHVQATGGQLRRPLPTPLAEPLGRAERAHRGDGLPANDMWVGGCNGCGNLHDCRFIALRHCSPARSFFAKYHHSLPEPPKL